MAPPPPTPQPTGWRARWPNTKLGRVLAFPDFRLLWLGSFVSFTGGWVQNVAQGYFVYHTWNDEARLAFVNFCWSMPVAIFGFLAGSLADTFDKRRVLVVAQAFFAVVALFLASATHFGFVQYWHIVGAALLLGTMACIEMPTRQSILSRVVPAEVIPSAVPVSAMTFNIARIFGPAIGGVVLANFGVSACYLLNAFTFTALIWAVLHMKSDLSAREREPQPLKDLIFEGMLYTFRDARLRALFLLETITAAFGLTYIPLMPAYVKQALGFDGQGPAAEALAKQALGYTYTAIGVGAFIGLLIVTALSDSSRKGTIIRAAMWTLAIGLPILSVIRTPWAAYPVLALLGAAGVAQFNTTNALFQTLSPDRLRGRVLAMHVWALNGLAPFGVLFFGWLAKTTRTRTDLVLSETHLALPSNGVVLSLQVAGFFVLIGAIAASLTRRGLSNLQTT